MKNLIRLELNKITLKPHFIGIIIANIIILILSIFASTILSYGGAMTITENTPTIQLDTITISTLLIKTVLIIWQSVLISLIIIKEFQNKTIDLLFVYPVNRTKLFLAKVLVISMMMIVFYVSSYIFQNVCISFLSNQFELVTYYFENIFIQSISIVSSISIGMIPLAIGMIKQSTIITIVSSLIIVAIATNSQGATAGLISIPIFAIFLGMIGIMSSVFAIRKIVTSDLSH